MREALGQWLRAYANKDGRGYPDWAVRYVPIARRLRPRVPVDAKVLEVGANENGLARFLRRPVIVVDLSLDHVRAARRNQGVTGLVADAAALPFRDEAFDACVSMDTFEHLPPDVRGAAARELVRVLKEKGNAAVGFPCGAAAGQAEADVREAYQAYTGRTLHWLEEHAAQGLPDADAVAEALVAEASGNRRVSVRKNGTLTVWRVMWRIMMCGWPGAGNAVFQALLRMATPLLCRLHVGVCYRAVVWVEPVEE
ncbi:MAG: class I SAM-dependent methyltransferase [bacterium]|nr:class I SAM-dependent methyltransferase [bacterium]